MDGGPLRPVRKKMAKEGGTMHCAVAGPSRRVGFPFSLSHESEKGRLVEKSKLFEDTSCVMCG